MKLSWSEKYRRVIRWYPVLVLLLAITVVLAAGCLGALTGKGIDRSKLSDSDKQFEEMYVRYLDAMTPDKEGVLEGMESRNWDQIKTHAHGMKNTSELYGSLLRSNNYTVSHDFQKYRDAANYKIAMEQCTAENLIHAAEREEIHDTAQKEHYKDQAHECIQESNRAGVEIILMFS